MLWGRLPGLVHCRKSFRIAVSCRMLSVLSADSHFLPRLRYTCVLCWGPWWGDPGRSWERDHS